MSVLRSHNNKTRGGLGRVCATGPLPFRNFKPEFLLNGKLPLSSSIDDSLLAWIGLLDGTRIRILVNLLYLGIRDNHWNYVNFEPWETHCN